MLARRTTAPQSRHLANVSGSTGTIPPMPKRQFLGITKLLLVSAPFIYIGGMISMHGASFLEDYDIFVPEDDDDD